MFVLELLNPRRVAAQKLARMIAREQSARVSRGGTPERVEAAAPQARKYDALEALLDDELRKYGMSLG